jgi:hypothetical protein
MTGDHVAICERFSRALGQSGRNRSPLGVRARASCQTGSKRFEKRPREDSLRVTVAEAELYAIRHRMHVHDCYVLGRLHETPSVAIMTARCACTAARPRDRCTGRACWASAASEYGRASRGRFVSGTFMREVLRSVAARCEWPCVLPDRDRPAACSAASKPRSPSSPCASTTSLRRLLMECDSSQPSAVPVPGSRNRWDESHSRPPSCGLSHDP